MFDDFRCLRSVCGVDGKPGNMRGGRAETRFHGYGKLCTQESDAIES